VGRWLGAPLEPTRNPLQDAVGPAAYAEREEQPERTLDGHATIVPMRIAIDAFVAPEDPDPRGMLVIGADGKVAGTVTELWVDRSEPQIRYLEAEAGGNRVLVPMTMARVNANRRHVKVESLLAHQIAEAPFVANPDQITKREEDRICGYFAGGHLYATPQRLGPIL
jgi:photosynthetic reaction center H subunit